MNERRLSYFPTNIAIIPGVISGVGKGIIASSTGLLLKTTGLTVSSIKIDPYINIDAGTMSPIESVSVTRHFGDDPVY